MNKFKVGDRVISKHFGRGKVIELLPSTGSRFVKFDSGETFYFSSKGEFKSANVVVSSWSIRKLSLIERIIDKLFGAKQ